MTDQHFVIACNARLIDENVALENDHLLEAIKLRDDELIIELLNTDIKINT